MSGHIFGMCLDFIFRVISEAGNQNGKNKDRENNFARGTERRSEDSEFFG